MFNNLYQSLVNIPSWAYGLLIVLIILGIQATRPKVVSIKMLLFSPIFFLVVSAAVIYLFIPINFITIGSWLLTFFAGSLLGWFQLKVLKIKAVKNTKSVYIPGSYYVLLMVIFLIALKAYLNLRFSYINPKIFQTQRYAALLMALYGLFTGLIVGRIAHAYKCLWYGPYIDINDTKRKKTSK